MHDFQEYMYLSPDVEYPHSEVNMTHFASSALRNCCKVKPEKNINSRFEALF